MDIWVRFYTGASKTKGAFECSTLSYSLGVCTDTEELTVSVKVYLLKRKVIKSKKKQKYYLI